MLTVRINSILGGRSQSSHFAAKDQFKLSLGIDPGLPTSDITGVASGLLRPVAVKDVTTASLLNNIPMWIFSNPKDTLFYVYDAQSSIYTVGANWTGGPTGLSDGGNESGVGAGNGAEYSDNYIYFSRNTTIARYGPLNGTPSLNGDYWGTTLAKTALVNTVYPSIGTTSPGITLPNHVLHRHSDGRLYIADVVGNQGTIHYIATTKGAVEGDTDNNSKYNALQFGYGLWPTAMESYGSDLVIALLEGNGNVNRFPVAKLAFWDTTSQNFNKITWVEFPDQIITALKNVNGVLYVISCNAQSQNFRLSRFVGGYTVHEIAIFEAAQAPFPGGVANIGDSLLFGCRNETSGNVQGCVFSYGLRTKGLGNGLFNILTTSNSAARVTALALYRDANLYSDRVIAGWSNGNSGVTNNGIDVTGGDGANAYDYSTSTKIWWSQLYRIGMPFEITRIRFPLAQTMAPNMIITVKIYTDDGNGTTFTLPSVINNTNYSGLKNINMKIANVRGEHNFWIELAWTGSALLTVALPITIDYKITPD